MKTIAQQFHRARLVEFWCAEPVFFASRELSDTYYTEATFGNYALAYALGWARSNYRLTGKATGRPTYLEDLKPLAGECYVLPAWPSGGKVKYRMERFNALSDSYWYAMSPNRVVTAREDLPLKRTGKNLKSFRPSNFPQTGRLRLIDRGNRFRSLVFGDRALPEYLRLGKFMSKIHLSIINEFDVVSLPVGEYETKAYLNSADLPADVDLLAFDLIAIPPASILKNLRFRGAAWQLGNWVIPANLKFCGS